MRNKKVLASVFLIISSLSFSVLSAERKVYIDELNAMSQEKFEQTLDPIFEKTPWAIKQAGEQRPYKGFVDLYEGIIGALEKAEPGVKLALIQSHPDLACKGIRPADVTSHSQNEQSGAGLDQCTQQEAELLVKLNKDYQQKFGFPFMLAIKGYNREEIIAQFQKRINNDKQQEFDGAMQQIYKVVLFRLLDKVK